MEGDCQHEGKQCRRSGRENSQSAILNWAAGNDSEKETQTITFLRVLNLLLKYVMPSS